MEKIVVWGAAGHALVVADILRLRSEYEIAGFLDDIHPERHGDLFCGAPILGGSEQVGRLDEESIHYIIMAIGNNRTRLMLSDMVRAKGLLLANAVHPAATVASDVIIGAGTVVAAGAVINPGVRIGSSVIINTCASVDHECTVEDGAHIGPGSHLGGLVTIRRGAWVGIGATIRDRVVIGAESLIGAGAVVVDDIPSNVVAYGVPAKVKRTENAT